MVCDCVNCPFTKKKCACRTSLACSDIFLKTHLIDIQFPEIVLIVCKFTDEDRLNSTWKFTSVLLNTICCHGYKVRYFFSGAPAGAEGARGRSSIPIENGKSIKPRKFGSRPRPYVRPYVHTHGLGLGRVYLCP